jgi:hypothetical protein
MPGLSGSVMAGGDGWMVFHSIHRFPLQEDLSSTVSGDPILLKMLFIWSRSYLIWHVLLKKIVTGPDGVAVPVRASCRGDLLPGRDRVVTGSG